ncbi:MAG TPA: RICIN domain-containing protein, partial [Spirochaetota bacterium]|nr:RICIN domain-containing protein [Spirochaetota bacterium]
MNFKDFILQNKNKIISILFILPVAVVFCWITFDIRFRVYSINENRYYQIINKNSGKRLDVPGSASGDNVKIIQYDATGSANQLWKFVYVSKGLYKIKNKYSQKCLDILNENGVTYLVQNQDNNGSNQKWILRKSGGGFYFIVSSASNNYLDVPQSSKNSGEKIILYP